MATHFHIQELKTGLRIQSSQDFELWQRLLVAGFLGTLAGVASANFFGGWWWTILSPIVGAAIFVAAHSKNAKL